MVHHTGVREVPHGGRENVTKTSIKSAPHMGFVMCVAGFDIGSIETHHETSGELSNSAGDDIMPLGYPIPGHSQVDKNLSETAETAACV